MVELVKHCVNVSLQSGKMDVKNIREQSTPYSLPTVTPYSFPTVPPTVCQRLHGRLMTSSCGDLIGIKGDDDDDNDVDTLNWGSLAFNGI